jgi:hypothetical protein
VAGVVVRVTRQMMTSVVPGVVVVSDTVKNLVVGSDLRFEGLDSPSSSASGGEPRLHRLNRGARTDHHVSCEAVPSIKGPAYNCPLVISCSHAPAPAGQATVNRNAVSSRAVIGSRRLSASTISWPTPTSHGSPPA